MQRQRLVVLLLLVTFAVLLTYGWSVSRDGAPDGEGLRGMARAEASLWLARG